jgi:integrase
VLTQPPKLDRASKKLGWTLDEAKRFLDVASEHRLYAAFHLCLVTGMRRGEVLVITTALGGWVDPNNFGRLMDSLIEAAGVARITPKGLRHTAQSVGRVVVGDDMVM